MLSRQCGESIRIGDDVVITIVRISPTTVRLGIAAPGNVNIVRSELVKEGRTNGKKNSQSEIVGESGSGIAANLVGGTGISRAADSRGGDESGY